MTEILRAGCFEGKKRDPEALCQKPDCRLAADCIWKKERDQLSSSLGSDQNKTEAVSKTD